VRFQLGLVCLSVVLLASSGCGKTNSSDSAAGSDSASRRDPSGAAPSVSTPTEAVTQFYEALRDGEEAKIASLLTDKARRESANSGLDIRSPGSASLTYEVGEWEYVTPAKDGAHVKSIWTELDDEGTRISTEVIWVLRKQADGWRVAGMATQVKQGQLPLLFNFEDPADMIQKRELVEREHSAAAHQAEHQAAKPETSDSPTEMR
jgi:hypothetical protein